MSMLDELKELDVNVDEALHRFMNKTALYEKMLMKLPGMMQGEKLMETIDAGDINGAIEIAHTLKGVLGNLSITPLFEAYTKIVALLREDKPDEAKEILADSIPIEEKVVVCIEKYR